MTKSFALLLAAGAAVLTGARAEAQVPDNLCGSKADMVGIMLRMYEDGVEKVAGDNKMFVKRDNRDGSHWVIALPNTTAHPAVACRSKSKEFAVFCTASEKACASFRDQATQRLDKIKAGG